jgi:hypothetical protein
MFNFTKKLQIENEKRKRNKLINLINLINKHKEEIENISKLNNTKIIIKENYDSIIPLNIYQTWHKKTCSFDETKLRKIKK